MANTRRGKNTPRMRQSSPRMRQSSPRSRQTTPRMRKRTTTQRIKNRTTSQRKRKSSSMKNNEEFKLFEYLINEKLSTNKVKKYLNKKITNKHPLFELKEFMMKPKTDTEAYLKQCIKLFVESHQKFLDSFDIEKSFKKDKKAVKIITSAIKQRFKTFKPGRRNMSGGNDKETCVICLELIDNSSDNPDSTSQKLFGDDCTHYRNFHKNCINDWVMTAERTRQGGVGQVRASCPLCKREIQDEFRRTMINEEQIQEDIEQQLQQERDIRQRRMDTVVRNERRRLRREGLDYLLCSLLCFIFIKSQLQQLSDRREGFNFGTIQEREEMSQEREREHNQILNEIDQQLQREANMTTLDVTLERLSRLSNPDSMQFFLLRLMYFFGLLRLIRMPALGIVNIYRSYTLTFNWEDDEMVNQFVDLVNEEEDEEMRILREQGDMFFDNEFPEGGN